MRSAIAVIMAVLGVILVLGDTTLWASALVRQRSVEAAAGSRFERGLEIASRLLGAERLITWGVVLLALSAIAAGAISFSATATTGSN